MNELKLNYPGDFKESLIRTLPDNKKAIKLVNSNDYFLGSYLSELLDDELSGLSKKQYAEVEALYDLWIFIVEEQMDSDNLVEVSMQKKDGFVYDKETDQWLDELCCNDSIGG